MFTPRALVEGVCCPTSYLGGRSQSTEVRRLCPEQQLVINVSWSERLRALAFALLFIEARSMLNATVPVRLCPISLRAHASCLLGTKARPSFPTGPRNLALPAPAWLPLLELRLLMTASCPEHLLSTGDFRFSCVECMLSALSGHFSELITPF